MDSPTLETHRHHAALQGLERINRISNSARLYWPALRRLAATSSRPLRVLDLACGGGDVLRALQRRAQRAGLTFHWTGCDVSPVALAHAEQAAHAAGAPISFLVVDLLQQPLPSGYDVLLNSLFLHHLDPPAIVPLLQRMQAAAGRLVLVNDLVRSRAGWLLAWLGTRLLTRSDVVHHDGLRSVEAAFTLRELNALVVEAGWQGHTLTPCWPYRMLLTWTRPGESP